MGIDRKTMASVIGLLSIVSSLAFWIEVALGKTLGRVPGWIDMGLSGWVAGWVLGVLLVGWMRFVLSHPWRRNKDAPWMGQPGVFRERLEETTIQKQMQVLRLPSSATADFGHSG